MHADISTFIIDNNFSLFVNFERNDKSLCSKYDSEQNLKLNLISTKSIIKLSVFKHRAIHCMTQVCKKILDVRIKQLKTLYIFKYLLHHLQVFVFLVIYCQILTSIIKQNRHN